MCHPKMTHSFFDIMFMISLKIHAVSLFGIATSHIWFPSYCGYTFETQRYPDNRRKLQMRYELF